MPTYDLGLEHVSLAFATKTIFTDVTQGVFEGDRIGIVAATATANPRCCTCSKALRSRIPGESPSAAD